MTEIFGDLGGYLFGNFRDTANNIIWRYATPCWHVNDYKMNDLEARTLTRYFMTKAVFCQHFLTQSVCILKIIA